MFAPPTMMSGLVGLIAIDTSFGLDAVVVDILIFWNCGSTCVEKTIKNSNIGTDFMITKLSLSYDSSLRIDSI